VVLVVVHLLLVAVQVARVVKVTVVELGNFMVITMLVAVVVAAQVHLVQAVHRVDMVVAVLHHL
jgi:hypothetical protein